MQIPHNMIAGTRTAADMNATVKLATPFASTTSGVLESSDACARRILMTDVSNLQSELVQIDGSRYLLPGFACNQIARNAV